MENVRVVTDGLVFPEGPVPLADGSVVVVEIQAGRVTRVAPDGAKDLVADTGGGPNGAAVGPDGALYVCNNGGWDENAIGGRIQRVDLDTGEVETLYDACDGQALVAPNDIVFDASGGFWFTDLGNFRSGDDVSGVYWARPDGSEIRRLVHPAGTPNGIGLSPAGDVLYYAQTPTATVQQRPVVGPGELGDGGVLADTGPGQMFDSLAVDAEGNVCVATLNRGGITVVTPEGKFNHVPMPAELDDRLVTNIAFGGPDLRTAYITLSTSGRLVACDWPTAGLPLAYSR